MPQELVMTLFDKCIVLAMLAVKSPCYLKTLSAYTGISVEDLREFLLTFPQGEGSSLGSGSCTGEDQAALSAEQIEEFFRSMEEDDGGILFGIDLKAPIQLAAALQVSLRYPWKIGGEDESHLNVINLLLKIAGLRLKTPAYRHVRERGDDLFNALCTATDAWAHALLAGQAWGAYQDKVQKFLLTDLPNSPRLQLARYLKHLPEQQSLRADFQTHIDWKI